MSRELFINTPSPQFHAMWDMGMLDGTPPKFDLGSGGGASIVDLLPQRSPVAPEPLTAQNQPTTPDTQAKPRRRWPTRVKQAIGALSIVGALAGCASEPHVTTVTVDSTSDDTYTGVRVNQGDEVTMTAHGSWTVDVNNHVPATGPKGYDPKTDAEINARIGGQFRNFCLIDKRYPNGALLFRIDDGDGNRQNDSTGLVGESVTFRAEETGEVAVGINDLYAKEANCRSDNKNLDPMTVTITTQ